MRSARDGARERRQGDGPSAWADTGENVFRSPDANPDRKPVPQPLRVRVRVRVLLWLRVPQPQRVRVLLPQRLRVQVRVPQVQRMRGPQRLRVQVRVRVRAGAGAAAGPQRSSELTQVCSSEQTHRVSLDWQSDREADRGCQ